MKPTIIVVKTMIESSVEKSFTNFTDQVSLKLQSPRLSTLEAQTAAMDKVRTMSKHKGKYFLDIFLDYVVDIL